MPETNDRTAAHAIVEALVAEGVDTIFGIPGVHNLAIYDALADRPEIRRVTPRHEDGAALMANGYARATGRPGVIVAAAGPGVTNTITGMATAYGDSVPLLLIASQVQRSAIGRETGELHDINDQLGILRVVSGWTTSLHDPAGAASAVHAAFASFRSQRPRPASIEAPVDVLTAKTSARGAGPVPLAKRAAPAEDIERAARILAAAVEPAILVGGGAADASEAVLDLAERLNARVVVTSMGLGIVPDDHPLCVGTGFDLQDSFVETLAAADVVLAVGTRFTNYTHRAGKLKIPGRMVHVDIDAKEIGRLYPVEVGLLGHAEVVLAQLRAALGGERSGPRRDVRETKAARRAQLAEAFALEMGLADAVRHAAPRDTMLALDMTGLAYWVRRVGMAYAPRTVLYPLAYGGLGFGLPCAIGAKLGRPDRPVLAICGDAGFQYSMHELATAVALGQGFPVVIVNDAGYSALRPRQQRMYGRTVESDLKNPDFVALARAFGADGVRAAPAELGPALERAFASDRMTVIEVPVELRHPEAVAAVQAKLAEKTLVGAGA